MKTVRTGFLITAMMGFASAADAGTIRLGGFNAPRHGDVLRNDSPYYDDAVDRLFVAGRVGGLEPFADEVWIELQGERVTLMVDEHGRAEFGAWIDYSEQQSNQNPYGDWFGDDRLELRPVLAELVDGTGRVLDRERMLLYDMRGDLDTEPKRSVHRPITGAAAQLTPGGLVELNPLHLELLPYPNAAHYQRAVDAQLALYGVRVDSLPKDTCADVPGSFTDLDAYGELKEAARKGYRRYQRLLEKLGNCTDPVCVATVTEQIQQQCFHERAIRRNFDVCADTLRNEPEALSVDGVVDATLRFETTPDRLGSEVTLGAIDGDVSGELRDIRLQWGGRKGLLCLDRPNFDLSPEDLATEEVVAWRLCPRLDVDAASAVDSDGPDFGLSADGLDPRALDVRQHTRADFGMLGVSLGVDSGGCGEGDFAVETLRALEARQRDFEAVLGAAWDEGYPSSEHSKAIELMLEPLETGMRVTADLEFSDAFEQVFSDDRAGALLQQETDVHPVSGADREPASWFYPAPYPFPEWSSGRRWDLYPFDLSLSVNTGRINQVLRALAGTDRLTDVVAGQVSLPRGQTRGPRGLATSGPGNPQPRPWWSGGNDNVEIAPPRLSVRLRPTLTPFTVMARDLRPEERFCDDLPPGETCGKFPVSLQVGQLLVEVVDEQDRVWMRLAADLYERNLVLGLDGRPHPQTFVAAARSPRWDWTVLDINASCSRARHASRERTCETAARDHVVRAVQDNIERILYGLVAEVPLPQIFGEGWREERGVTTGFWDAEPHRERQNITFYLHLL